MAKRISERLNLISLNQQKLRADHYIHLRYALHQDANVNSSNIGQHVILPLSFIWSRRYLHEKTQDAMTYVSNCGRPNLFVTFTCSPKWEGASSGIAAVLLNDEKTAYSTFKLQLAVSLEQRSVCSIRKNCSLGTLLQETSLII